MEYESNETTNNTNSNINKLSNILEFSKIIKDLLNDLINTFPDKTKSIIESNKDFVKIINYDLHDSVDLNNIDTEFVVSSENIFKYCISLFPERFFDILYQNDEIFLQSSEVNTNFLPNIDFKDIYYDTTSEQTKETLWKYLQLILFTIITCVENPESFGNNEKLFSAINNDEFKNKLQDTVKEMEKIFNFKKHKSDETDETYETDEKNEKNEKDENDMFNFEKLFNSMNIDSSNSTFNNLPDVESIHDHINNIMNGKIGCLAKELAEETTKDLDIDTENIKDVNDVFKQLFKNPNKLMSIVNNIGGKIDKKMKDGSIKESELLEEATSIFNNMKSMPGMENFNELFKTMNLDNFMPKNGKFNNNAFQNMMDQNIKMSKMRERMRKKAQDKSNTTQQNNTNSNEKSQDINLDTNNLSELTNNLNELMKNMSNLNQSQNIETDPFISDILKRQNINKQENTSINESKISKKKPGKKKQRK